MMNTSLGLQALGCNKMGSFVNVINPQHFKPALCFEA
jgi:hypothetical protein